MLSPNICICIGCIGFANDILWRTFKEELCSKLEIEYRILTPLMFNIKCMPESERRRMGEREKGGTGERKGQRYLGSISLLCFLYTKLILTQG